MARTLKDVVEKRFKGREKILPVVRYVEAGWHDGVEREAFYEGIIDDRITVAGEDKEDVRDVVQFLELVIEAAKTGEVNSALLTTSICEPPTVINEPVMADDGAEEQEVWELPEDLQVGQVVYVNPGARETTIKHLELMNYHGDGTMCVRTNDCGWAHPRDLFLEHALAVAADEARIEAELALGDESYDDGQEDPVVEGEG